MAIVAAVRHFLDSLDDKLRRAATYRFANNAQRSNSSNFPEGMVPRGVVKLGVLSELQRANLNKLLGELLSKEGVRYITHQMAAEDLLIPGDLFGVMNYGSGNYYAAIFGEPSTIEPWMFQFGGHHLAINVTVFGPNVSFSPMLTGGQLLHLRFDGDDIFILQRETTAVQAFMDTLQMNRKNKPFVQFSPSISCWGPESVVQQLRPKASREANLELRRERYSWM